MKLKQKWGNGVWEPADTAALILGSISSQPEDAIRDLAEIVARLIDSTVRTDREVFEIVDPYSTYELVEAFTK